MGSVSLLFFCYPFSLWQSCSLSTTLKLNLKMTSLPLLLCLLLLLPASLLAKSCCDEPSRGCFPVRCEDDCSYKPCQHAPCNGDSIGQMWCVNKEGERITDIGWFTCGSRFATFKDCAARVKAWEAANGKKTGA